MQLLIRVGLGDLLEELQGLLAPMPGLAPGQDLAVTWSVSISRATNRFEAPWRIQLWVKVRRLAGRHRRPRCCTHQGLRLGLLVHTTPRVFRSCDAKFDNVDDLVHQLWVDGEGEGHLTPAMHPYFCQAFATVV
ncbi:hypothetical protein [Kocuria kalidii]|uniref:hypothetical protein n=1 Tax=Kocuria kalidii TaxID=3376283 RepID=UPI0037B5411F